MNTIPNNPLFKPINGTAKPQNTVETMLPNEVQTSKQPMDKSDSVDITAPEHRVGAPAPAGSTPVEGFSKLSTHTVEGLVSGPKIERWHQSMIELEELIEYWANEAMGKGLMGGASGTYVFAKMDEYLAKDPSINDVAERLGFGRLNGKIIKTTFRKTEHPIQKYDPNMTDLTRRKQDDAKKPEEKTGGKASADDAFTDFRQAIGLVLQQQKLWGAQMLDFSKSGQQYKGHLKNEWAKFVQDTPVVRKYYGE